MLNDIIAPIIQTGAVGCMLIMTWRLMVKKDQDHAKTIEAQNQERKEMYANMSELVREVTQALTYKNTTDDAMSKALEGLTAELRSMKKDGNNEKAP